MRADQVRAHYSPENLAKVLERAKSHAIAGCMGEADTSCSNMEDPQPIETWCPECCLGFLAEHAERANHE